jgi:hypothetical protein
MKTMLYYVALIMEICSLRPQAHTTRVQLTIGAGSVCRKGGIYSAPDADLDDLAARHSYRKQVTPDLIRSEATIIAYFLSLLHIQLRQSGYTVEVGIVLLTSYSETLLICIFNLCES